MENEQTDNGNVIRPLNCSTMTQLEVDAINVLENRVDINTFPKEYQQQIQDFYRFHPVNIGSNNSAASQGGRGYWK